MYTCRYRTFDVYYKGMKNIKYTYKQNVVIKGERMYRKTILASGLIGIVILVGAMLAYKKPSVKPEVFKSPAIGNVECKWGNANTYVCDSSERIVEALATYKAPKVASVSAYSSRKQETDDTPEIGATGENLWHLYKKGIHTVASNDYKLGTVLEIGNLGRFIVKDRMNRRYTGKGNIDIYMGYNTKEALKFGRKNLIVRVIE